MINVCLLVQDTPVKTPHLIHLWNPGQLFNSLPEHLYLSLNEIGHVGSV